MSCAWYFAGALKWPVTPRPAGQGRKQLDMEVETPEGKILVEVKSPYRELVGGVGSGNDSDLIEQALREANEQFAHGHKNILFLAPQFRFSLAMDRYQIIEALIGKETLVIPLDKNYVPQQEAAHVGFKFDGKFTRPIKSDRSPGFTRVSAVVVVEEVLKFGGSGYYIDHSIHIVHNPYAAVPLSPKTFGDLIQFMPIGDGWGWSDGKKVGH